MPNENVDSHAQGTCTPTCPRVVSDQNGETKLRPFLGCLFNVLLLAERKMDQVLVEEVQAEEVIELSLEQLARVGGGGVICDEGP
jgi:hypothetical protein